MTRIEYDRRTATMLLTFANADVRRAVTTGNVLDVSGRTSVAACGHCIGETSHPRQGSRLLSGASDRRAAGQQPLDTMAPV